MFASPAWWWLLATLSVGLTAEEASFSVNTKRYSHVVSDRFLSITIDPALLLDGDYAPGINKIMNLARGLAPAYVRIGSPASNSYQFLKSGTPRQQNTSYAVTEAQWMILNDFAQKSGLEPIVCVNIMSRQGGVGTWDTRNLRDLVAYSDRRKYKLAWQFGYELQNLKNTFTGAELGSDVKTLRSILDSFPRYKQATILGPDIMSTKKSSDVEFLKDFLTTAGDALSAVTWHAFDDINNTTQYVEETNTLEAGESVLADKLGEEFTSKPLWIAESYRDPGHPSRFEDGMSWAVKLGEAAKIGIDVVMQRPQIHNLQTPTPDYWISFLHKTLVGEVVLANDWIPSGEVHMFSHCTNTRRLASNMFVNDQLHYEEGSMTFFGVNWLPTQINISLKLTSLVKQSRDIELHEYIITPDSSHPPHGFLSQVQQVPKVLLNGRQLAMDFSGRLPILTPRVHHYTNKMMLTLPRNSVGFWVVSGAKVRACLFEQGGYQGTEALGTDSREETLTRVRRSAEIEPEKEGTDDGYEGVDQLDQTDITEKVEHVTGVPVINSKKRHKDSKVIHKKSIANSKIIMEIGNWKENGSKTKDSEKGIHDQSKPTLTAERSLDETATEAQIITSEIVGEHIHDYDVKNNGSGSNPPSEQMEKKEKSKYHISKVLVVFENDTGEKSKELYDEENEKEFTAYEEIANSYEKEFHRVQRALEKDSHVPGISLSLLDIAALREPLISLKKLREKRWEELQQRKLMAGQEYKKALGLQASMLFPKKLIPNVAKLTLLPAKVQLKDKQNNDYDYVTEEEQEFEERSRVDNENTHQYDNGGQWNVHGNFQNKDMIRKPNGMIAKYGELWEVERGLIDNSNIQERQRQVRENADVVHVTGKRKDANQENPFVYGTRNERVPESYQIYNQEKNPGSYLNKLGFEKTPHFDTTLRESTNFQYHGKTAEPNIRNNHNPAFYGSELHKPTGHSFLNKEGYKLHDSQYRGIQACKTQRCMVQGDGDSSEFERSNQYQQTVSKNEYLHPSSIQHTADITEYQLENNNREEVGLMKPITKPSYRKHRDRRHLTEYKAAITGTNKPDVALENKESDMLKVNNKEDKQDDGKDVPDHDQDLHKDALHSVGEQEGKAVDLKSEVTTLSQNVKTITGSKSDSRNVLEEGTNNEENHFHTGESAKLTKNDKHNKRVGIKHKNAANRSNKNVLNSNERNVRESVADTNTQVNSVQTAQNDNIETKLIPLLPKLIPMPKHHGYQEKKLLPLLPKLIPIPKHHDAHKGNLLPLLPKGNLIPLLPKGNLIPLLPKGNLIPLVPKGNLIPLLPKGNLKPLLPKFIPIPKKHDEGKEKNFFPPLPKLFPVPKTVVPRKEIDKKVNVDSNKLVTDPKKSTSSVQTTLHNKFGHLVSDIKSRTHKRLDELEKKKLIPILPTKKILPIPIKLLPTSKVIIPSLTNIKDKIHSQQASWKARLDAFKDKTKSNLNTVSAGNFKVHAATSNQVNEKENIETPISSPLQGIQNSFQSNQKLEAQLTELSEAISNYPNAEPGIVSRSTDYVRPTLDDPLNVTAAQNQDTKLMLLEPLTNPGSSQLPYPKTVEEVGLQGSGLVKPSQELNAGISDQVKDQLSELTTKLHVKRSIFQPLISPINVYVSRTKRAIESNEKLGHNLNDVTLNTDKNTYSKQHSKKRFLNNKDLRFLDSATKEIDLNHPAKSTDYRHGRNVHEDSIAPKALSRCPTRAVHSFQGNINALLTRKYKSDSNINTKLNSGHVSLNCFSEHDNKPLKTLSQTFSNIFSDSDEVIMDSESRVVVTNGNYRANTKQVGGSSFSYDDQHSAKQFSDKPKQSTDNERMNKNWHMKNKQSNNLEIGEHGKDNVNRGYKSDNWHLISPIINENQIDKNKRSKRYVDLFSDGVHSNEFLNKKLSMVDSNGNEDLSHNKVNKKLRLKGDIPSIKETHKFEENAFNAHQKLKHDTNIQGVEKNSGKSYKVNLNANINNEGYTSKPTGLGKNSGDVSRVFQDWNFALSPMGINIVAEQAQEAHTFRNYINKGIQEAQGYWNNIDKAHGRVKEYRNEIDEGYKAKSLAAPRKEVQSKEQGKTVRTHENRFSRTDEDSEQEGFFGHILKKIYSLFHSIFNKAVN